MKKRLMAMLLISALVLSCISINIAATGKPVVSIGAVQCAASQDTTSLIQVPIKTTAFIGGVTTAQIDVYFDNTKLVYNKTLSLGTILATDGNIAVWAGSNQLAEDNANASGHFTIMYDDNTMGSKELIDSNVISGTNDTMVKLNFKRKAGATGTANISVGFIMFSTDDYSDYTNTAGDIDVTAGSITFADAATPTPEPTATPTPVPTATPEPTAAPTATPVPTHDITVSIDDTKGMVINNFTGLAVKNGDKLTINTGASQIFKIVAYGGYKIADVTYGGGAPAGNGMFKCTVNTGAVTSDASLVVTFSDFTAGKPEIDSYNHVFVSTEDGQPIAVSYGTVHGQIGLGACGIILWSTADADVSLAEATASRTDAIHVFSAINGGSAKGMNGLGQFGVKIKELPDGVYKMKTYVVKGSNVSYGDIVTFSIGIS